MNAPHLESLESSQPRLQHPVPQNSDAMLPSVDTQSLDERVRAAIVADPTILDDVCDGLDEDEVEWVRS